MRAIFQSAHSVQGIVLAQGSPDVVLFQDPSVGVTATLTLEVNRHLAILNRQLSLASMLLRAMIGDPLQNDFHENLSAQIKIIERQRMESAGTDPVLVVQTETEVPTTPTTVSRQIDDFTLCFDAFDKKALRKHEQVRVSAVLAALRVGGRGGYRFKPVADGSYLVRGDGHVVHSLSMEAGSLGAYVSAPLTQAELSQIADDTRRALKNKDLAKVMRLHAASLNTSTDNYRAFLSSWSALEILVAKLFPTYQARLASDLRNVSAAPGLHSYLDRVAAIMDGKHSLADKFSVISIYLDRSANSAELDEFRRLKQYRDRLAHGEEIHDDELPTSSVQSMFDKYMSEHLRSAA